MRTQAEVRGKEMRWDGAWVKARDPMKGQSPMPQTHTVEEEEQLPSWLSTEQMAHAYPDTHMHIKQIKEIMLKYLPRCDDAGLQIPGLQSKQRLASENKK